MNGLSLWNDGAVKCAILDFVERVCRTGGPEYLVPTERVAVFDNDGTLWCEKPLPILAGFLFRRLATFVQRLPDLHACQPWKAVVENDCDWLSSVIRRHYEGDDSDLTAMVGGLLRCHSGVTVDAFAQEASDYLRTVRHPRFDRCYLSCTFSPMTQLLRYLAEHGFTNYIATGGGRDFMRPVAEELYGIKPEAVIGSSAALTYQEVGGTAKIVHLAHPDIFEDGAAKAVQIWSRIGRRPVLTVGNSNGDIPMLHYCSSHPGAKFSLLVEHDDAEREYAYTHGADRALLRAADNGWTILSMARDWREVFSA